MTEKPETFEGDGQQKFFHPEPHTQGIEDSRKRQPPKNLADGMIKALRPKQWVKNVLVLAAPAAAGADALFHTRTLLDVALAFIVFCLGASSIYLINDARDVDADRAHPTKRFRPIAAGVLPVNLAYVMSVVLIVAAVGLSFLATSGLQLALVIAVYIALQLGYCFGWKHMPVIDIALVSSVLLQVSNCPSGSCWLQPLVLCSWLLVSATPRFFWQSAPAPRFASLWLAIPRPTCALYGLFRLPRW